MATVVKYDTQTNYVTGVIPSAHTPDHQGAGNLINPNTTGLNANWRWWIHDNGSLRDMTQAEYDTAYPAAVIPDYGQLRVDMLSSADWARIKGANDADIIALVYMYVAELDKGDSSYGATLIQVWNGIINPTASITTAEAAAIDTMLSDNNIPFTCGSDGDLTTI